MMSVSVGSGSFSTFHFSFFIFSIRKLPRLHWNLDLELSNCVCYRTGAVATAFKQGCTHGKN